MERDCQSVYTTCGQHCASISSIYRNRRVIHFSVGDSINVRVVSVDEEKQRIELAIADGNLPVNVVVKAKV